MTARHAVAAVVLGGLLTLCGPACAPTGNPAPATAPRPGPSAGGPHAAASLAGSAALPTTLVLSVLPFEDRTRTPELAWLRKGLADMLVAELARNPSLLVVQRQRLEEVIREQALQLSGRVADESAVRVGRLAGATVLVTGSVSLAGGVVRLDAQLLGVENGAVLGTAVAEGPAAGVAATARELVERVAVLLPGAGDRRTVTVTERDQGLVPAARHNEAGEALTREGKLFQALEAYERALAAHPGYPAARANYAKTVRELTGADLLRTAEAGGKGDERVVGRLVERLVGSGLEAELVPARPERAGDGSVAIRVAVRLRLAPAAVEAVTAAARAMGGREAAAAGAAGPLEVVLSADPEVNRAFTRALAAPRRAFLRLQGADGRTLAVYSRLRGWRIASWVAPLDDRRVRIERGRLVDTDAVVTGLTLEQAASLARVSLTVDAVARERATVHLDASEVEAPAPRHIGPPRGGEDEAGRRAIEAVRTLIEEDWDPPITERPWGRGYVPGNERVVGVTMVLDLGRRTVEEPPRLVGTSGDSDFDSAALAAADAALQRWRVPPQAGGAGDGAPPGLRRVRAQFRLLKDVPALNLIGPLGPPAGGPAPNR